MSRDYPRLTIAEFGRHLLESEDLDPVYVALNKMEMTSPQLCRWLVAYWCFYSCALACYASERQGTEFWDLLKTAALNQIAAPSGGRWPRGHERRHFRGSAAFTSVERLAARYPDPVDMVNYIRGDSAGEVTFKEVSDRVEEHHLFGPWIGFKVADMLDRLEICRVKFDEAAVFMFKEPREAALRLWRLHTRMPETARPKDEGVVINMVVAHLQDEFKSYTAPPLHERPVGLQEIETILCKWKSHLNGHYPPFNDIDEIAEGLVPWLPWSNTATAFAALMPKHTS